MWGGRRRQPRTRSCRCPLCGLGAWLRKNGNGLLLQVAGHLLAVVLLAMVAWVWQLGAPVSFGA